MLVRLGEEDNNKRVRSGAFGDRLGSIVPDFQRISRSEQYSTDGCFEARP